MSSTRGTAAVIENLLKHKWSRTILRHFRDGIDDPVEIARLEMDIAPSAMRERLRTMVRHNLVHRVNKYPRAKVVLYRLTPKGRRVLGVLDLIGLLDRVPDGDPRPLEEVFGFELRIRTPVLLLGEPPAEPVELLPASLRKNSTKNLAVS